MNDIDPNFKPEETESFIDTKPYQKPSQKPVKLSKLDKCIITAATALQNPTKADIVNCVVEMGGANHKPTVYNRLRKKDYLQRDLAEIKKYHQEMLEREQLPLAAKVVTKALKNKDLKDSTKYNYVKLVYDKAYGETHNIAQAPGVSIGAIQNAQIFVNADVSRNLEDED